MITARLLNQDATFNNYKQIGGISFVNGDTIRIVIQLFNEELGLRHIPSITTAGPSSDVQLGINFSDNTFTSRKDGQAVTTANPADVNFVNMTNAPSSGTDTSFATDRSIWYVDIPTSNAGSVTTVTATDKTLVGGNIIFRLSNDTNSIGAAREGIIFNALQRQIVS